MNEKYILIKESVLNSRIEELKQKQAEEFCMQDEAVIYFNVREELQSLKQKGEVVEIEELGFLGDESSILKKTNNERS